MKSTHDSVIVSIRIPMKRFFTVLTSEKKKHKNNTKQSLLYIKHKPAQAMTSDDVYIWIHIRCWCTFALLPQGVIQEKGYSVWRNSEGDACCYL